MLMKQKTRMIVGALVSAVVLAACGGAAATDGGNSSGDSEFGLSEAEVVVRVEAVEASIADCMTEAGFEYFPVDYETARIAMDSNSKPSNLTDGEYRDQFGYGITTDFAVGESQAVLGTGSRNLEIKAGLSTATLLAYERALYGEDSDATFIVGLDDENLSNTGGCTRIAVEANFSPEELGSNFVSFQNDESLRVDQDPRIVAAIVDWATCMREAGFSFANADEIETDLANRFDSIVQGEDPATLTGEAATSLSALQGEEVAIAAADQACEVAFVDAVKTEVELELLGPDADQ